jgi:hypothetical protein
MEVCKICFADCFLGSKPNAFLFYVPRAELFIYSTCLWANVWPHNSCFIPNLSISKRWEKMSTINFTKPGISSEDLQDLILAKAHKGKSKTGDETPIRTELGEKASFVPCFLSSVLFPSWLLISSQFQWYWEPSRPVWRGTLHLTPVSCKRWWKLGIVTAYTGLWWKRFQNIISLQLEDNLMESLIQ